MSKEPQVVTLSDLSLLKSHPQWALSNKIYQSLSAAGFLVYFAGGCVRDLILGRSAKDLDLATSATPAQVKALFTKTVDVGENFGVTRIIEDGQMIEVAAFRTDGAYKDGRRPDSIEFSDPEHDAERRDFTINALFLDLKEDGTARVIDYVGGLTDLDLKVLKAVGSAEHRFAEDHLRILRALRFSAQTGFEIDSVTMAAVKSQAPSLKSVSGERVRDEILKLLKSERPLLGLEWLLGTGVFEVLFEKPPGDLLAGWGKIFPLPLDLDDDIFLLGFFWPLFEDAQKIGGKILESSVERIKPTRDEKKYFKMAEKFVSEKGDWRKKSLGEKIIFLYQSLGPTLLAFTALFHADWEQDFLELQKQSQIKTPLGRLPVSYLKGDDVAALTGADKGWALQKAFIAQIEGEWTSREEALAWLKNYQKGLP